MPLLLGLPVVLLFTYWGFNLTDLAYSRIYGKPLIVHDHIYLKKLAPEDIKVIASNFSFYNKLSHHKQKVFGHRVQVFISDKEFIGLGGFKVSREVKLLVASVSVMLSFGMRTYLIRSIEKVIIYPNSYFSAINQEFHLGEFNPLVKAIVFSWEDFLKGLGNEKDNINLAVHEFAHAINYSALHRSDSSSLLFSDGIKKIKRLLSTKSYTGKIRESNYLRRYAYTSEFEFFAVCLEHFIETPAQFKKEFPELFEIIKKMMNFEMTEV
ncbi:zinc-dependent peptidase [Galbibacter sp. EGI 63066]|uniref:zinc-dependent peptidase n=1 Tax=Galbibacter sp. EGI 63066 TaxID=2993559 RepID=UPI00224877DE|nr:zinc-dependent peptidase [Galbibacter sp. EGI 63066]MCX2680481.1 zinc-dependent peptidase [Galbibacter sp. EGI 63066]